MPRLFHVSDLHFGRADQEALDWFAARVREERPDGVIVTGDLTMRARSAEWAPAAEWLAKLEAPLSIEPGNHDLPYYNPFKRIFSAYSRFERVERAVERPICAAGVWVVPLRTTTRAQWRLNWSWGIVHRKRLNEALTLLRAKPPGHLAIIACHHPLVDSGGLEDHAHTRGGREALDALSLAGAEAVLSGHVHDAFDAVWPAAGGAIRLIGAGTLSERVRSTPPSFNELIVDDGALNTRVRQMNGEQDGTVRTHEPLSHHR